jgi:hypothetical protein
MIFVPLLFFFLWAVLPTGLEMLQSALIWTSLITAPFLIWALWIKLDRVQWSKEEGRPL